MENLWKIVKKSYVKSKTDFDEILRKILETATEINNLLRML